MTHSVLSEMFVSGVAIRALLSLSVGDYPKLSNIGLGYLLYQKKLRPCCFLTGHHKNANGNNNGGVKGFDRSP
jgi:hypothetical protein